MSYRTASSRTRVGALLALPLTIGLLAGCGAYQDPEPAASSSIPADHPEVSSEPGSDTGSEGSADASSDAGSSAGDRPDQRAVAAAAERAASFGFTEHVVATEDQVQELRDDVRLRRSNSTNTTVDPGSCKAPLTAVDWSPLVAQGEGASRVDVGSSSFRGTGTIEVAAVDDESVIDRHVENVARLVEECGELSFTVDGMFTGEGGLATYDLVSSAPDIAAENGSAVAVESALLWSRTPVSGDGSAATAQVLMGRAEGYAVMVSFIGAEQVADEEFTTMAQAMLEAALTELES